MEIIGYIFIGIGVIDFEKKRIIVVNTLDQHYNWKKIVYKKIKQ